MEFSLKESEGRRIKASQKEYIKGSLEPLNAPWESTTDWNSELPSSQGKKGNMIYSPFI